MSTLSSSRAKRSRIASRSGSGPTSGWYLAARLEVLLGAEPGAGEQDLADLDQQQGYDGAGLRLA